MKLCGREECVYAAAQNMINKMKEEVVQRQSIVYEGQIVVAKIYDVIASILAEACRRNFAIDRANCEPSNQFHQESLTLDTFILLNQLKEDGFIGEEYKSVIFEALIKIDPEVQKIIEGNRGLV